MAEKTVENYITQLEDWQAEIVSQVRQIILEAAPGANESIKWAQRYTKSMDPSHISKPSRIL